MIDKSKLNLYTRRILAQINPNIIVNEKVLDCVDQLLSRFIKVMIQKSSSLVQNVKKNTIMIPDLEASVKLKFPNCFAEDILIRLAASYESLPEEGLVPISKIKLKMKKYAEISRISKTSVHFFSFVIEAMIREMMTACVNELLNRKEYELKLEHLMHAFHNQPSFLELLRT